MPYLLAAWVVWLAFQTTGMRLVSSSGEDAVALISPDTGAVATTIPLVELPFAGKVLDVSPSGTRAGVSHPADNRVSIIDLVARTVVRTIQTGKTPDGVAWIPDRATPLLSPGTLHPRRRH